MKCAVYADMHFKIVHGQIVVVKIKSYIDWNGLLLERREDRS